MGWTRPQLNSINLHFRAGEASAPHPRLMPCLSHISNQLESVLFIAEVAPQRQVTAMMAIFTVTLPSIVRMISGLMGG